MSEPVAEGYEARLRRKDGSRTLVTLPALRQLVESDEVLYWADEPESGQYREISQAEFDVLSIRQQATTHPDAGVVQQYRELVEGLASAPKSPPPLEEVRAELAQIDQDLDKVVLAAARPGMSTDEEYEWQLIKTAIARLHDEDGLDLRSTCVWAVQAFERSGNRMFTILDFEPEDDVAKTEEAAELLLNCAERLQELASRLPFGYLTAQSARPAPAVECAAEPATSELGL